MNTISIIKFSGMRNEEFRSFHHDGTQFAKKLTGEDLQHLVRDYDESFRNFSSNLTTSVNESSASKVGKLRRERNQLYVNCRRMAMVSMGTEHSQIGEMIYKVFTSNPIPSRLNQAQSSGVIIKIIESLRLIGNENLEKCNMKTWVDRLDNVNQLYHEAFEERSLELGRKVLDQNRKLREKCVESYKELVKIVNAKSTLGDKECSEFIETMNGSIKIMREKIKLHKKNVKSGENSSVNTETVSKEGVDVAC